MPFSLIKYRYTCQNTAADEQQCDPLHEIAVVAGLRRLRFVRQLSRYGSCLGDFFSCLSIAVILPAILAVPVFYIALGIPGRRLGGDMLEVEVVIRVRLTVGFAADFAYCLALAGFLTTDVVCDNLSTVIAYVILIRILVVGNHFATVIADVILIRVLMVGDYISANVAYVVFVCIGTLADYIIADITFVVFILIDAITRFDTFRTAVCRALTAMRAVAV